MFCTSTSCKDEVTVDKMQKNVCDFFFEESGRAWIGHTYFAVVDSGSHEKDGLEYKSLWLTSVRNGC